MEWFGEWEPELAPPKWHRWPRVILRGIAMLLGTGILLVVYLLFYGIGKFLPLQVTKYIAQIWARMGLFLCGLKLELRGKHMAQGGALVANHASWIDIFSFNAAARVSFVAKAEVRNWPLIGFLGRITGTLFIERRQSHAKKHQQALLERLERGDQLCFFPEGTSTDGMRVLKFRSTLFSVFHTPELIEHVWVQPATVTYFAPKSEIPEFYGWWGDMGFLAHILTVLACPRGGRVRVTFHEPVRAADFESRKALAAYCEDVVRKGLEADLAVTSQF